MKMKFYNMKLKKTVMTDKYKPVKIKGRSMAVATVNGTKMYTMMPKK